ncbi:hypothetical protein BDV33DRAFT_199960 [Aspergillus novoparasiticus]|uniref:Zn(2)-C6 fungal-type domain-containing protein n=1 Tax=Aspergillus novoparasiticus TaxID=986946 RepID=A0A5N6F5D4_9EURO|nr:hypothetical protein BDV33DRAFT_199960 [Aspergillus novoparasiticus]
MASSTDSSTADQIMETTHRTRSRNMTHPRKRAVTACEHCRARKIKCTNERPECRSCVRLGARCSYDQRVNHSSFDPASLLILDKLDQVLRRLPHDPVPRSPDVSTSDGLMRGNNINVHTVPGAKGEGRSGFEGQGPRALDGLQVPSSFASTDSVLAWPVFGDRFGQGCLAEELFIAEHLSSAALGDPFQLPPDHGSLKRGGICEDDIPNLVTRFLHLVHIKNPILDSKSIKQYAYRVAENGLGWDASSCLVLLACALGAIAAPFDPRTGPLDQHRSTPAPVIESDKVVAKNYYQLACRRLGLLDRSLLASQCYLLSGIYLMYTIRPLEARFHFYQASSIYAIYLKGQVALQQRRELDGQLLGSANRRLEQRLYWTCFKSECEIRLELDLPVSELATLAYPDMFPSPPTPLSPIEASQTHGNSLVSTPLSSSSCQQSGQSSTFGTPQEVEEQSWYYYLSEIALRRIGNRVLHYFYKEDNRSWSQMNIYEAVAIAEDLEVQLQSWESSVPIQFRGLPSMEEQIELRCMIHGRFTDIKCLLYRPFLYYAIHHKDHKPESNQMFEPLAQKALSSILELTTTGAVYHRNHGTWFICRLTTTSALLLLAATKSGLIPRDQFFESSCWGGEVGRSFKTCLDVLKYWESESPDILKARQIVESLRDEILGHGI